MRPWRLLTWQRDHLFMRVHFLSPHISVFKPSISNSKGPWFPLLEISHRWKWNLNIIWNYQMDLHLDVIALMISHIIEQWLCCQRLFNCLTLFFFFPIHCRFRQFTFRHLTSSFTSPVPKNIYPWYELNITNVRSKPFPLWTNTLGPFTNMYQLESQCG